MNRMKRIGDMSLKGSDRYYLRHRRRTCAAATPSSLKGSDRYYLRHRRRMTVPATSSLSLKGSDRCYLRHRRRMTVPATSSLSLKGSDRCCSPSGCCPSRKAIAPQGAARGENLLQPFRLLGNSSSITHGVAIEHYLSQHSVPHSNAASFGGRQSLKGSDRYSLRHRRRTCAAATPSSLKGSYIYCLWHRHWLMVRPVTIPSLKGSDRYTLRHRRRMLPIAFSSMSLKGSDRYYPVAQPRDLHTTNIF